MPREAFDDYDDCFDFFEDMPRRIEDMNHFSLNKEAKAFIPNGPADVPIQRLPLSHVPMVVSNRLNQHVQDMAPLPPLALLPDDGSVHSGAQASSESFEHGQYSNMPIAAPSPPQQGVGQQVVGRQISGPDATPSGGLSMQRTLMHDMLMKATPDFYED